MAVAVAALADGGAASDGVSGPAWGGGRGCSCSMRVLWRAQRGALAPLPIKGVAAVCLHRRQRVLQHHLSVRVVCHCGGHHLGCQHADRHGSHQMPLDRIRRVLLLPCSIVSRAAACAGGCKSGAVADVRSHAQGASAPDCAPSVPTSGRYKTRPHGHGHCLHSAGYSC